MKNNGLFKALSAKVIAFNAAKRVIGYKIAVNSKKHFEKNFDEQGFDGQKWKPVNRFQTGRGKAAKTNPILQGKGAGKLRKLVIVSTDINNIQISTRPSTDVYAKVHNEGLKAGRGKGFTMPKRQFIGNSEKLNKSNIAIITKVVGEI